jgi:hypothetical protein
MIMVSMFLVGFFSTYVSTAFEHLIELHVQILMMKR